MNINLQISVLAIGPADLENLIVSTAKDYQEIDMDYVTYSLEDDVASIVKKHEQNYDVLFFAGSLPYAITKEQLNLKKRMVYIEFKGTALYRVLFQLIRESKADLLSGNLNLSIDNLQKFEIEECFDELDIQYQKLFYYEGSLLQDIDRIVEFHYELWQSKQTDIAITCVGSVYERLKELGVPASRIIPTRTSIRTALDKVLMERINLRHLQSQVATGIIQWNHTEKFVKMTEYQFQRKILDLKNIMINYGEKLQAIIKWTDHKQELKFITTRGALQFEKNHSSNEMKLLKEIYRKTEIIPRMGIGIGQTTNEAEIYAREALAKSPKDKLAFYVRDIDGIVHGPIGGDNPLSYSTRNNQPQLIAISKQANLSGSTINRILSFSNSNGESFTSTDLATGLGISIRSARRILHKLEQADLAEVTGEEQPIARGRPRQIYSLARLHRAVSNEQISQ